MLRCLSQRQTHADILRVIAAPQMTRSKRYAATGMPRPWHQIIAIAVSRYESANIQKSVIASLKIFARQDFAGHIATQAEQAPLPLGFLREGYPNNSHTNLFAQLKT
jgi:hypothetical protein